MKNKKTLNSTADETADETAAPSPPSEESVTHRSPMVGPFVFVVALAMLSGIVHGMIDGRWLPHTDLIAQGQRLHELPESCGNWKLVETQELAENAERLLQCYGSEVRVYRHEPTAVTITVAVLFGPRGPIAVHTPEICFSSDGRQPVGERQTVKVVHSQTIDNFWSIQFTENPSPDPSIDVLYGWSDGGSWVASKHPRFWLTDNLYKLQISGPVGDADFQPCKDFLTSFLPELRKLIATD